MFSITVSHPVERSGKKASSPVLVSVMWKPNSINVARKLRLRKKSSSTMNTSGGGSFPISPLNQEGISKP
jgi:hypothetical protein